MTKPKPTRSGATTACGRAEADAALSAPAVTGWMTDALRIASSRAFGGGFPVAVTMLNSSKPGEIRFGVVVDTGYGRWGRRFAVTVTPLESAKLLWSPTEGLITEAK